MASIGLERFQQQARVENVKIGFDAGDRSSLATRPAEKPFAGRVASWFANLGSARQTEKREVMQAFQNALKGKFGDRVGTAAFDAVFPGGIRPKSLTSRQVNEAIRHAENQLEANALHNLSQAQRYAPGGSGFVGILADAGLQDGDLDDASKASLQKNLLEKVQRLSTEHKQVHNKPVDGDRVRTIASNLAQTLHEAQPYMPPSGTEFTRIAANLGVDTAGLDHAALAEKIRDGLFENGEGNTVLRSQDIATEVMVQLVKIGVAEATQAAETDERVQDANNNIRDNTPIDKPKHFRDIVNAQINTRVMAELQARGRLGDEGIGGIVRSVIQDVSDAIDTTKASIKGALDQLAGEPPDTAALASSLLEVVSKMKLLVAGGDDLPTSLKIAFNDAFGQLDGPAKQRIATLLGSQDQLGALVDDLAAGVGHAAQELEDEDAKQLSATNVRLLAGYVMGFALDAVAGDNDVVRANVEDASLRLMDEVEPKDNAVAKTLLEQLRLE